MATPYIGNPDYRGYLNYLAQNGDKTAGNLLGLVGNDGKFSTGSDFMAPLSSEVLNANKQYYADYSGANAPAAAASGPSAADRAAMADEQAYWDDQIANADSQLGRLSTQRGVADQNIDRSYTSAYDTLTGQKQVAERDYGKKRNDTVQDNIGAKSNIDTGVRQQLGSLRNVIRTAGSARDVLAPYMAAAAGNDRRQTVQKAFSRNLDSLDTGWADTTRQFGDSFNDLITQRDTKKNDTRAQFDQTEAGLLEAKGNAAVQRGQAGGMSYASARAARTPFAGRIQQLLSSIDSLGLSPTFTPKAVQIANPNLDSYTYDRFAAPTAGSNVDPSLAGNVGSFWTLIADKKKDPNAAAVPVAA